MGEDFKEMLTRAKLEDLNKVDTTQTIENDQKILRDSDNHLVQVLFMIQERNLFS